VNVSLREDMSRTDERREGSVTSHNTDHGRAIRRRVRNGVWVKIDKGGRILVMWKNGGGGMVVSVLGNSMVNAIRGGVGDVGNLRRNMDLVALSGHE